jgi:hypothetical protein
VPQWARDPQLVNILNGRAAALDEALMVEVVRATADVTAPLICGGKGVGRGRELV